MLVNQFLDSVRIAGDEIGRLLIIPAMLVLRGLSVSKRPGKEWTRPNGARLVSPDDELDAAFGKDRLVYIFLATLAFRLGNNIVEFRPKDIGKMFGLDWSIKDELLRLRRVLSTAFFKPGCGDVSRPILVGWEMQKIEERGTYRILLTDDFMEEVAYGAPVLRTAAIALSSSPASLDLYMLHALCASDGKRFTQPVFDEGGLCQMLQVCDLRFKARQSFRERESRVIEVWRGTPYEFELGSKSDVLRCVHEPRAALAAHLGVELTGDRERPAPPPAPATRVPSAPTATQAPATRAPSAPPTPAAGVHGAGAPRNTGSSLDERKRALSARLVRMLASHEPNSAHHAQRDADAAAQSDLVDAILARLLGSPPDPAPT